MSGGFALYCVHGEWITIYEVAARAKRAKSTIDNYRTRHHCTAEAAFDHYDALNRGEIVRKKPGPKPKRYRMGTKKLTVREAAGALGVSLALMYRYIDRYGDLEACARAIEKNKTDRAVREVVKKIKGAGK